MISKLDFLFIVLLTGGYIATDFIDAPRWVFFLFLIGLVVSFKYVPAEKPSNRETDEILDDSKQVIPSSILEGLEGSGVFATGIHEIEDKYHKELQMAKNVQQGLLSAEIPSIPGIEFAMACIPAENVGGDFYTLVSRNRISATTQTHSLPGVTQYVDTRSQQLGIAIGDVAGHGIASALVMALTSGILRELCANLSSPAEILRQANSVICKFISNSEVPYVTAFFGVLSIETRRFVYTKAGHHPCVVIRKDESHLVLETEGVFLGMFSDEVYEEKEIQLMPGDRLMFYTDGLLEVKNSESEMLGTDALIQIFKDTYLLSPADAKTIILDRVSEFSGGAAMDDDRTLVILHVCDDAAPASV